MKVFRGTFLDIPRSPFTGGHLRSEADLALVVDDDGVIVAREPYTASFHAEPDEVVDLREGLVLPGFVDTHVHYPQVRAIGGLGMPLLDWLEKCALPEEARLAEASYAAEVAADFVSGLVRAGTTTALVFGSHFATAVDARPAPAPVRSATAAANPADPIGLDGPTTHPAHGQRQAAYRDARHPTVSRRVCA